MQEMMMPDMPLDMPLDAWSLYRRWINWTPKLSSEEEETLLLRLEQGQDDDTETRLVAGYQGLVQHIARRHRFAAIWTRFDTLDLIQEGTIGLIQAIRSYACGQSCSFQSFAGTYIERAMLLALRTCGRVHMPFDVQASVNKLRRLVEGLVSDTDHMPPVEVIAQAAGKTVAETQQMLDYLYIDRFVSFEVVTCGEDGTQEHDVPDCPMVLPDVEPVMVWQNAIERAFQVLTEKQRLVLRLRYGLDGQRLLASEVASLLGMREEAIQSLEYYALKKLTRMYSDPAALLAPPSNDYYTPSEAAAVLGMVVGSVHNLARRGVVQRFEACAVGFLYKQACRRDVCFLKSEIDALAAARRKVEGVA